MKIYGLANCDTTKAAMKWLKAKKLSFEFHDFKIQGITISMLESWIMVIPIEKLLNKRSTTWRGLTPAEQASANSEKGAIALMQQHTSLIKRPVIEWGQNIITVGYDEAVLQSKSNNSFHKVIP